MDSLLESVLESTDFLRPYLKQFSKHFDSNSKLVEIASTSDKYINILKEYGINIKSFENELEVDGILSVHTNMYENNIEELFNIINSILKEDGLVFFVIRDKTNIYKSLEYHLLNNYNLVEEYISDNNWKFILYQKSTIK